MVIDVSVLGSGRHEKPRDDDEEFLREDLLLDAESGASVELPLIEVVGLLQLVEFFCLPAFAVQLSDRCAGVLRSPQRREVERRRAVGSLQLDGTQLDRFEVPPLLRRRDHDAIVVATALTKHVDRVKRRGLGYTHEEVELPLEQRAQDVVRRTPDFLIDD